MDDILCDHIGRCSFSTENHSDRRFRFISCLDIQVFINCIQSVHLLAFVLMETFYLNIEDRIFIQIHVLGLFHKLLKLQFFLHFDLGQLLQHLFIIFISQEFLQLICILLKSRSDKGLYISSQFPVAVQEPAAESNTVCLVVELLRIDLIEVVQLCILQDLCMKGSYAVYRKSVVDIHVSHVDSLIFVNDIYRLICVFLSYSLIQLFNDRKKMGNHFFQIIHWPFFQSFRQDGVVRISAGLAYDFHCFVHSKSFGCKEADQFRDDH